MSVPTTERTIDAAVDEVIAAQTEIFLARQPESREMSARASRRPRRRRDVKLADRRAAGGLDEPRQGIRGSSTSTAASTATSTVGTASTWSGTPTPRSSAAVSERVRRGTHFAQPTEDSIIVAQKLRRRFGLPQWRFANSGTEATMDAVHLMRAFTDRDLIIKVEGCYHGHHDSVQVSVLPEADEVGPVDAPTQRRRQLRHPARRSATSSVVVPFNDLTPAVQRVLEAHPGQIAGMIVEPIMMNAGIIHPDPGYLAGLRDLLHAHDALLTFDEVKTGSHRRRRRCHRTVTASHPT